MVLLAFPVNIELWSPVSHLPSEFFSAVDNRLLGYGELLGLFRGSLQGPELSDKIKNS